MRRQLDSICNDFEDQWCSDSPVDFDKYLTRVAAEHHDPLLWQLLDVDVELRLKAGQAVKPEDYHSLGSVAIDYVAKLLSQQEMTIEKEPSQGTASWRAASSIMSNQIGPYKLLQQIGEGGMGTVWMADQQEPVRRRVALKVIKSGLNSKQVIARFEAERQALAMMDHQNIAKVLDAGMTKEGRPYFAMELVQGIPINKYCDDNMLSLNDRLELFVPVCQAIQHAHQKGIIHRDLKPSNVLVTLYDGKPVPKVIDFGLAKSLQHQTQLTDKTLFTEFGQVVGTLQYMSPEQAEMNALDVDTRTDIYSMGVMLYELLTGSTPLKTESVRKAAILDVIRTIKESEPPRPSTRLSESGDAITGISKQRKVTPTKLQQTLRGELDWIVMKALEKDRSRRYETASGLAQDVQRFLANEAVFARPPSAVYRLRKAIRRHRVPLLISAAAIFLVVAAITMTLIVAQRGRSQLMASQLVERLVDAQTDQVENILEDLQPHQSLAADDLYRVFENSEDDSTAKLHAAMAISKFDVSVVEFLGQRLVTVAPRQFELLHNILKPHQSTLIEGYWQIVGQREGQEPQRFQAACALASFDPENKQWENEALIEEIAQNLVRVLPSHLATWRNALSPIKSKLTGPLMKIYADPDTDSQFRSFATDTLNTYLAADPVGLFELLVQADQRQFSPTFQTLSNHRDQAIELAELETSKRWEDDWTEEMKEQLARRQSNSAVLLYRMGRHSSVWPLLKHSPDPRLRSYLIHALARMGANPQPLMARYTIESDVSIRRALLLCLGEFNESQLPVSERDPLIDQLQTDFEKHDDAGLHAATRWLLQTWGRGDQIVRTEERLQLPYEKLETSRLPDRSWYVNTQGQTFVILDAAEFLMGSPESEPHHEVEEILHQRKIHRRFAISATEVTNRQWKVFEESIGRPELADSEQIKSYLQSADSPQTAIDWYDAARYCNWLSEQDGIPEDQWCYVPNKKGKYAPGMKPRENYMDLDGYRLPSEAEWEYACRANANSSRYYGISTSLLGKYGTYYDTSMDRLSTVATFKPNDFGLFDMLGNALEWCHNQPFTYTSIIFADDQKAADADYSVVDDEQNRAKRGGSIGQRAPFLRSAHRLKYPPFTRNLISGIRPVRTCR